MESTVSNDQALDSESLYDLLRQNGVPPKNIPKLIQSMRRANHSSSSSSLSQPSELPLGGNGNVFIAGSGNNRPVFGASGSNVNSLPGQTAEREQRTSSSGSVARPSPQQTNFPHRYDFASSGVGIHTAAAGAGIPTAAAAAAIATTPPLQRVWQPSVHEQMNVPFAIPVGASPRGLNWNPSMNPPPLAIPVTTPQNQPSWDGLNSFLGHESGHTIHQSARGNVATDDAIRLRHNSNSQMNYPVDPMSNPMSNPMASLNGSASNSGTEVETVIRKIVSFGLPFITRLMTPPPTSHGRGWHGAEPRRKVFCYQCHHMHTAQNPCQPCYCGWPRHPEQKFCSHCHQNSAGKTQQDLENEKVTAEALKQTFVNQEAERKLQESVRKEAAKERAREEKKEEELQAVEIQIKKKEAERQAREKNEIRKEEFAIKRLELALQIQQSKIDGAVAVLNKRAQNEMKVVKKKHQLKAKSKTLQRGCRHKRQRHDSSEDLREDLGEDSEYEELVMGSNSSSKKRKNAAQASSDEESDLPQKKKKKKKRLVRSSSSSSEEDDSTLETASIKSVDPDSVVRRKPIGAASESLIMADDATEVRSDEDLSLHSGVSDTEQLRRIFKRRIIRDRHIAREQAREDEIDANGLIEGFYSKEDHEEFEALRKAAGCNSDDVSSIH